MKFTSIFFTASAQYLRAQAQRYAEARDKLGQSKIKYEVYFDIFYSERTISSSASSKICRSARKFTQARGKIW